MKNLFKAIAEFQQECPVIHKGTKGHNYTYADLPTIFEVINPLLKKHGLGFTQELDGGALVTTIFHVERGEFRESRADLPIQELRNMNIYQSYGSGLTYFRRYCISCCLGIVTDKDSDASGQPKTSKPTLDDERFKKSVEAIKEGKYKKESLINSFALTPQQLKQLK